MIIATEITDDVRARKPAGPPCPDQTQFAAVVHTAYPDAGREVADKVYCVNGYAVSVSTPYDSSGRAGQFALFVLAYSHGGWTIIWAGSYMDAGDPLCPTILKTPYQWGC